MQLLSAVSGVSGRHQNTVISLIRQTAENQATDRELLTPNRLRNTILVMFSENFLITQTGFLRSLILISRLQLPAILFRQADYWGLPAESYSEDTLKHWRSRTHTTDYAKSQD